MTLVIKQIDGIIPMDCELAKELGFTSDKFESFSYLWKQGEYILISMIESKEKNKGYLKTEDKEF